MNGILLIDKPPGVTSAAVVRRVKRILPRGAKVGPLGTLDPFATGLLPLCLGDGTKIAQFLNTADKRYEGVVKLGAATDTGDGTGAIVRQAPVAPLDPESLERVRLAFLGEVRQRPPMFSAIKRDGVPLYRLARQGIEVDRVERTVRIDELAIGAVSATELRIVVACSKGTYVRVLAEDIGAALGTVAHLKELRRTGFGDFSIDRAVPLVGFDPGRPGGLLSVREALGHLPAVVLPPSGAQAARQGKLGVLARLADLSAPAAALVDVDGDLAAVVVRQGEAWRYGRVFSPAFTSPAARGSKRG